MSESLTVTLFDQPIGNLVIAGEQSPQDWIFTYKSDYLASSMPVPRSVAIPLQADAFQGAVVRNWFCNLLPEGGVREAITARLRIPPRDDFALLAAIGGECAGAVSIQSPSPPAELRHEEESDLETLLFAQGEDADEGAWALLGTPLRLLLAGAQDKIAVIAKPDGRLRLPARGELSTHILKPERRRPTHRAGLQWQAYRACHPVRWKKRPSIVGTGFGVTVLASAASHAPECWLLMAGISN